MTGNNMTQPLRYIKAPVHRPTHLTIDIWLLLVVVTLCIFGLVMVYSASTDYSMVILKLAPNYMFSRQIMFMGVGLLVAFICGWIDYHRWQKIAVFAILITIAALIAVLILGNTINYATRTLIKGSIQPSEAAKLAIIIYLAVWLNAKKDQLGNIWFGFVPLAIILGFLGGLIVIQPDISATATIFMIGGIMFFLAGGDLRQIAIFLVLVVIVGWLVYQFTPTGHQRVSEYMISVRDLTQAPMHLARSLEAIVKGHWFGVGIGQADTKLTGLPVPPTDSIYAVIVEELGFIGGASLVFLYIVLLWRGLHIAQVAPDSLGKLLAAGISIWLALEALINMAVIVGVVPFAGNALPFISYGGSNLFVTLAGIGILMSISRASARIQPSEEKVFNAVVNLRWRDWRRGLSGSGSPRGATRK